MSPLVEQARAFAIKAHGDQKYGAKPYAYHLGMAYDVLVAAGFEDEDLQAAIWLHDVIEDTEKTREDVRADFGAEIEALVWACTGIGANRRERSADTQAKILALPRALIVKLADKTANGKESLDTNPRLLEMYRKEWPTFKERLSHLLVPEAGICGDPRTLVMWRNLDRILGRPV